MDLLHDSSWIHQSVARTTGTTHKVDVDFTRVVVDKEKFTSRHGIYRSLHFVDEKKQKLMMITRRHCTAQKFHLSTAWCSSSYKTGCMPTVTTSLHRAAELTRLLDHHMWGATLEAFHKLEKKPSTTVELRLHCKSGITFLRSQWPRLFRTFASTCRHACMRLEDTSNISPDTLTTASVIVIQHMNSCLVTANLSAHLKFF